MGIADGSGEGRRVGKLDGDGVGTALWPGVGKAVGVKADQCSFARTAQICRSGNLQAQGPCSDVHEQLRRQVKAARTAFDNDDGSEPEKRRS